MISLGAKKSGSSTVSLVVKLYQGSTLISTSSTFTLTTSTDVYAHTLSAAEAANITDYTDLRLDLNCTASGSSSYPIVYAFMMNIPGVPITMATAGITAGGQALNVSKRVPGSTVSLAGAGQKLSVEVGVAGVNISTASATLTSAAQPAKVNRPVQLATATGHASPQEIKIKRALALVTATLSSAAGKATAEVETGPRNITLQTVVCLLAAGSLSVGVVSRLEVKETKHITMAKVDEVEVGMSDLDVEGITRAVSEVIYYE
jgi:hypothetical protein